MNKEKLEDLCIVLEKVIIKTAEIYNQDLTNPTQKALLETIIGAAIWYLPGSYELYSGKISKNAEKKLCEGVAISKLTKEHHFPRKQAGKELLSETHIDLQGNGKKLMDLYMEKYGRFNLVLGRENKDLIKYQRNSTFIDDETSYRSANIELVEKSIEQLKGLGRAKTKGSSKKETDYMSRPTDEQLEILPEILNEDDDRGRSFTGLIINDQNIIEKANPSKCYVEFMNFVINNFSESIDQSIILSTLIKPKRDDESFGSDLKYPWVIKSSGNFFFSSHTGTEVKKRRIINIANELALQVSFLYD